MIRRLGLFVALLVVACGAKSAEPRSSNEASKASERTPAAVVEPDAYRASGGTGDAPTAYVRPERSSRLDGNLRGGRAREVFRSAFPESLRPMFVLAAGNRIAVVGNTSSVTFDAAGRKVDEGSVEALLARFDRGTGKVVAADGEDVPPGEVRARYALHDGAFAIASPRAARVIPKAGEPKVLEGDFDALEVAFDDDGVAHFVVKQKNDLALWSVPSGAGSIGRQKIGLPARSLRQPPILGRTVRVLALDDRMVALALDGKRRWEKKGAVTGGASITGDDVLLVADGARILTVDSNGKTNAIVTEREVRFVTPPILTPSGELVVASGKALHVYRPE